MTNTKTDAELEAAELAKVGAHEKLAAALLPALPPMPAKLPTVEMLSVSDSGAALPRNVEEQLRLADAAIKSGLMPSTLKTKEQVWLVMQRGAELGFKAYSSVDYLYPVNGRVRLTPAGAKALALQSGLLGDCNESYEGTGDDRVAIVTVKRRGIPTPTVGRFSVLDAKRAGLMGKDNWKSYTDRMLLARARGFAFMDAFGDLVGGMQVREVFDLDPGEVIAADKTPAAPVERQIPAATFDPMLASLGLPQNGDAA